MSFISEYSTVNILFSPLFQTCCAAAAVRVRERVRQTYMLFTYSSRYSRFHSYNKSDFQTTYFNFL